MIPKTQGLVGQNPNFHCNMDYHYRVNKQVQYYE